MNLIVKTKKEDYYVKYLSVINGILKLSDKQIEVAAVFLKEGKETGRVNKREINKKVQQELIKALLLKKFITEEEDSYLINDKINTSTSQIVFKFIVLDNDK